jgi:O-antigen/teichoic acid export membrane protein
VSLVSDTAKVTVSQGLQVALQLVYFLIAARTLGVRGLGTFAASLALVSVLGTFAALGTGNLLVMHVSRRPDEFREHWGNALLAIPTVGVALLAIAISVAAALPALRIDVVAILCASELLFNRMADTAGQAFQALGRFAGAAVMWLLVPALRVAAVVVFIASPSHGVLRWAALYAAATALAGVVAVVVVSIRAGAPSPARRFGVPQVRLGLYFSLSQAAASLYADIDKTMLAQLASAQAAGIYTAAYRAVNACFVPTIALFQAAYGRFFKRGENGIAATRDLARTLMPYVVGVNVVAALVMFFAAPLAETVLGRDYAGVVGALRWLALVPLLQSFSYTWGDVLTGAGEQGLRTGLQLGAAALNVGLNAVLDPIYSWRGAAWATLLTFAALAVALRLAIAAVGQRTIGPAGQVASA